MKVLCYGDSNTYGYDPSTMFGEPYDLPWTAWLERFSGWDVINEGMNGREIPDDPVEFSAGVDWIILMLGTNNLLQFWSPQDTARKMSVFLRSLSAYKKRIFLVAPPKLCFGAWVEDQELIDDSIQLAKEYSAVAEELDIPFLDATQWDIPLAYDGVHFTEEGHRIFAECLFVEIKSYGIIQ